MFTAPVNIVISVNIGKAEHPGDGSALGAGFEDGDVELSQCAFVGKL
jgi:hypothetical protein